MLISWRAQHMARLIKAGGVIAYPTEAVWGLGCDPWNADAVFRLLQLKQGLGSQGMILLADCIHQFDFLLEGFPQSWMYRLASSWPGPNTWLVPHRNRLPEWITGEHDTVALRVTAHPLVREVCALTGPIISTSANPAGRPAARSRLRVEQYFEGCLDAVAGGALGGRRHPSLIRELSSGRVVRGA